MKRVTSDSHIGSNRQAAIRSPNPINSPQVIVKRNEPGREIGARAFLFCFLNFILYFRERGNHEIEQQDGVAGNPVELKYCERCGGFVAASAGNGGVYCASLRCAFTSKAGPGGVPIPGPGASVVSKKPTSYLGRIDLLQGVQS